MAIPYSTPARGTIWLVGAGPGDPDLLTVKAVRALAAADVIVHDGLVSAEILALAPPSAERISVAKARSRHSMAQDAINALLIARARAGQMVVRLKGGDPFVFGRGGEEAAAAAAAAIPCTIIPGITAASGCAAAFAMPLTHRDHASIVSFVAGQCRDLGAQNWAGLAGAGRTLVIYMGLATANAIAEKLMADGLAPDMPVAVLENGTRAGARVLRSLLADLGPLVARHRVASPALIVIGAVAALGHDGAADPVLRQLAGVRR